MTPEEALAKLVDAATRKHEIHFVTAGPSHGDPGGYQVVKSACAAITHNGYAVLSVDDLKCDCRAKYHNGVVRDCERIVRDNLKP